MTAPSVDGPTWPALIRALISGQPLSASQTASLNDAFKVGQNDAFGGARGSQLAPVALGSPSRVASLSRTIGQTDLVGSGGAQDALAVAIYQPGSGTDF